MAPPPLQSILRADADIDRTANREEAAKTLRAAIGRRFAAGDDDERDRVEQRLLVLAGLEDVDGVLAHVPQESMAQELDWAFRRFLEQHSGRDPIVLIFEDVHWAQPSLLDTIEYLTER